MIRCLVLHSRCLQPVIPAYIWQFIISNPSIPLFIVEALYLWKMIKLDCDKSHKDLHQVNKLNSDGKMEKDAQETLALIMKVEDQKL